MKTVAYNSPFVPPEWIAAHGMQPRGLLPRLDSASPAPGEGVCPYAWALARAISAERNADAAILTTVCDQRRRASERIARDDLPLFLLNVPSTWQTVAAQMLYMEELRRLGRFLVRLGGTEPARGKLADVMKTYDDLRSKLKAARGRLSGRRYAEAIARFHHDGVLDLNSPEAEATPSGIPLALVGGPLTPRYYSLFDLIERCGGAVVLNATTGGERTLPPAFDRRLLQDDPFMALADAYFGKGNPDAFRRPNNQLYQWLKHEMTDRGVRGIIFQNYLWCDIWHAEAQRMKEWAEVPFLTIVTRGDEDIDGHAASRIESFLETLK